MKKFIAFAALALLCFGFGVSQRADASIGIIVPPFGKWDWHTGPTSIGNTDYIYGEEDCGGIVDLFDTLMPGPIGRQDNDNNKQIVGYEIICDGDITQWGVTSSDFRNIPRTFGWIRVYYKVV